MYYDFVVCECAEFFVLMPTIPQKMPMREYILKVSKNFIVGQNFLVKEMFIVSIVRAYSIPTMPPLNQPLLRIFLLEVSAPNDILRIDVIFTISGM